MIARALIIATSTTLVAAACSSSSDPGATTNKPASACETDTRKDTYVAGLSKSAGPLSVRIVDATPAPPTKGTNVMTLQIVHGGGKPVDGATVSVTPFMPDHGHGSAVVPVVTPMGDGKYSVSKIYLAMAGLWKLTITVTPAGGSPSDTAFSFCLDG
jgi:hypothetical protein